MDQLTVFLLISFVKCQYELQPKPERCYGTPEILYRQCCIFPPFFKREIAKMCGAKFVIMFINKEANVTGLRRDVDDHCQHWKCVLTKYGLMVEEDKLDDNKYFTHLDKWVNLNPEFSNVMLKAKLHCKHQYRFFMPLSSCEFLNFQSCIRNFINVDCPKTIPSLECDEVKTFYKECREYYL